MDYKFSETEFRHSLPIQMRFNDFDMFGHVNNTAYMQYMDIAKVHYFENVLGEDFKPENVSLAIVHIECDYLAQTKSDEEVEVITACTGTGRHTVKLEQRVRNTASGQVKCVCKVVLCGIDTATGQAVEISESWREQFARM